MIYYSSDKKRVIAAH